MNLLSGVHMQRLEGAMQASTARHNVINANVANVDTPYYKRSEVQFESLLRDQMTGGSLVGRRTDPRHFYIGPSNGVPAPQVVQDESTVMGNNRNNVDIDREMALQAENQLNYYTLIQQLNHNINMLRTGMDVRR
ncbi:flagellar basal body rod protein FlgB [Paenibacillus thiaminolyticus]|uniref:Flagellar basal body rod protein FlgB n=1 Tax=Paenibacillus thiaminolyticus TaxID=49283 RepID=A0AAJ1G7B4_PANTH|nr:flagellar basal body rod protein FlgB [Paenibacillus thiaminolyticus]MCY9538611.1 flagellar basal body rod protein FlgB [Paenibacillus thiaminolyticus]MCY9603274.1 flagellar basal body rod protein FlgB [Paenibacillus thiaminolyticus]MCY9609777.1 flagellar basal body rod protein FlgB [Paenibacillus thiaminolyticus]MCY9613721.1 flagellar basal body rod protein FlgB [Paenibacillus thiaminolyticus]MCY9618883.1 flagellar basal body rod protein FlgB [Paenibacillus thiaminolyticus]